MPLMEPGDGFRLYYEDSGGDGPVVVFLHGAGGNHLSWWQRVPEAGHSVYFEQPELFNREVRAFLRAHPSA